MAVRTSHEFNCLVLRDGNSYLTLTHTPPASSALILHDRVGTGGSSISSGQFSRKRWNKLVGEWVAETLADQRKLEREERKREREIAQAMAAAEEAKRKRRLNEDIAWAGRQNAAQTQNGQATKAAMQAMAQALREHSLHEAAARGAAERRRQEHQRMLDDAAAKLAAHHKARQEEDNAVSKWLDGQDYDEAAFERWLNRS